MTQDQCLKPKYDMKKVFEKTKLTYPCAKLSSDPGRYLCNYAYLQSRHRLEKIDSVNALFIHVPYEWEHFSKKTSTIFGFIENYCQMLYPHFHHGTDVPANLQKKSDKIDSQKNPVPQNQIQNPQFDDSYSDLGYKFMDFKGYSLQGDVQVFGSNWRELALETFYKWTKGKNSTDMSDFPKIVHALYVATCSAPTKLPPIKDCLYLMQMMDQTSPAGFLSFIKFKEMCTALQTRE